jgi:CHAD domain-containing protein
MKGLDQYLKTRKEAIFLLLEKPGSSYTPETFHKIRVEIKKLHSFFCILNYCSKEFKLNKLFKPFKLIFRQVGKVRELQVEEAMIKKYFSAGLLEAYKHHLKTQKLIEKKKYFSILNIINENKLEKKYDKAATFLKKVSKKRIELYIKNEQSKIDKISNQEQISKTQLHDLRKKIKTCNYNKKLLGQFNKKIIRKIDVLPDLIGHWHDSQITLGNLKKVMNQRDTKQNEKSKIQIIRSKLSHNNDILYDKIKKEIVIY